MLFESGAQANSSTQLSFAGSPLLLVILGHALIVFPVPRSTTTRSNLSDSYPLRACERHASHLPSGLYCGPSSLPGLVETFAAFALGSSSLRVKMSLLVDSPGCGKTPGLAKPTSRLVT